MVRGGISVGWRTAEVKGRFAKVKHYLLTYVTSTGNYRAHRLGCGAATNTRKQVVIDEVFDTIGDARTYADADESEKAGKATRAPFKSCECCRR